MIVYLDTSVLGRAYLPDEADRERAVALLGSDEHELVTGSWTRVELAAAVQRAARARRIDASEVTERVLGDLGEEGVVTVLGWHQDMLEDRAIELVEQFALRSLDALHLAYAEFTAVPLVPDGERLGFATHDHDQAAVARALGFELV